MAKFNDLSTTEQNTVINLITEKYGITIDTLNKIIEATDIKGVQFVSISGYNSAISGFTEVANTIVNVGVNYAKAKESDKAKFDLTTITQKDIKVLVENYKHYDSINTKNLSLSEYKKAVVDAFSVALEELKNPKARAKGVDNAVSFHKGLSFNTNTMNLSIKGFKVSKSIEVKGEFKVTAKGAKTLCKELIKKATSSKTAKYATFNLDNVTNQVSIQKQVIEGKEYEVLNA